MSKQPPSAPTASAIGPCSTIIQIVGRPGTGSLPRTIAPPPSTMDNVTLHILFDLMFKLKENYSVLLSTSKKHLIQFDEKTFGENLLTLIYMVNALILYITNIKETSHAYPLTV